MLFSAWATTFSNLFAEVLKGNPANIGAPHKHHASFAIEVVSGYQSENTHDDYTSKLEKCNR
jgi:hypothetical protein